MHGHTYKLEISFEGDVNEETGMVMDFTLANELCGKAIASLDHRVINEIIPLPTAENMIKWIKDEIDGELFLTEYPKVKKIKLWETPDSYAEENY